MRRDPLFCDGISYHTRWKDEKGRTWRVWGKFDPSVYVCVLVGDPEKSREWTTDEIHQAMAAEDMP